MKNFQFSIFNFQIAVLTFLLLPAVAFAATAVIKVDTGVEEVNALEGTLVLPESMNVREIQTGNSVILIWIEAPHQTDNTVSFAGITPGGFEGTHPVFSIQGAFTKEELEQARFESVVALKNDGAGTRVPVTLSLSVTQFKADTEPPEDFTPVIASDPNLLDGKYFLVFATQDKGTGIDRYEVREGRWGFFKEAESPYLLKHQSLDRKIFVKAIDKVGNERIAVLNAERQAPWYREYATIVILLCMSVLFVLVRIRRRHLVNKW
jgi:hypothetical protein